MTQDSSDIVFRLREAAKTMRAHTVASFKTSDLDLAADEIEKLRREKHDRDAIMRKASKMVTKMRLGAKD